MTIGGILFDKDGTLLDFQGTWVPLYKEAAMFVAGKYERRAHIMLEASGFDIAANKVLPNTILAQGNNDDIAEAWLPYAIAEVGSVDEISEGIGNIFNKRIASYARQVTDLRDLFDALDKRGLKLGVATSDGIESAQRSLAPFHILNHLDFLAGFDSGYGAKPEPGMINGFAEATGLEASQIMMVGDSLHDMEMGKAAGVGLKIGVLTGASSREDLSHAADRIIANISDIEVVLDAA